MPNVLALALALAAPAATDPPAPVPIQRPTSTDSTPPESATEDGATDTPPPHVPTTEQPGDPSDGAVYDPPDDGRIDGVVFDAEIEGERIFGAHVQLSCTCMDAPLLTTTEMDGRFAFAYLPAGVYTILVDRGGRPTRRTVSLGADQHADVALSVAPPTTSQELDRRRYEAARARTHMAIGGVLGVGALGLIVGALVENAKHECKFGLDDCPSEPRRNVAIGLGVSGAIAAVTGGMLIGLGVHRLRKLNASIAINDRELAFAIGSRF